MSPRPRPASCDSTTLQHRRQECYLLSFRSCCCSILDAFVPASAYLQATKVNMVRSAIAAFFSGLLPWKLQAVRAGLFEPVQAHRCSVRHIATSYEYLSAGTNIFA